MFHYQNVQGVNEVCGRYGTANVVLVSIHCNAAGNGAEWMNARGWSAYTSKGKTKADKLATFCMKKLKNFIVKEYAKIILTTILIGKKTSIF